MQRHLDGDLKQEEQEWMTNHLKACPDCSLMMERLVRIDQDLANLPKVTPSFSIVDSILPRLAEIDAAAQGSEAAALEVVSRDQHKETEEKRKPWRKGSRWYQLGGLVACAAVLGILIVNGLPETFQKSVFNTQQDTASSSGSSGAAPLSTAMRSSGATMNTADVATPMASPAEAMPEQGLAEEEHKLDITSFHEQSGDGGKASTGTHSGEVKELESVIGVQSFESDPPVAEVGEQDAAIQEVMVASESEAEPSLGDIDSVPMLGSMGISGQEAGEEIQVLQSEDGTLSAVVEQLPDGMVLVVVKDADGELLYSSLHYWPANSSVELQEWKDSTVTYQVTSEDRVQTFMIDIAAFTETEVK